MEFRFKKFSVKQEKSAMKVNTDGVLLACWTSHETLKGNCRVLDIGTGTGVISLITAQRLADNQSVVKFNINAIDIDLPSALEARINFGNSAWRENLFAECVSLKDFIKHERSESYNLIVTNPPFFNSSLLSPFKRKAVARHTEEMSFEDILKASFFLLSEEGRLNLILPPAEGEIFIKLAREYSLILSRICRVKSLASGPDKRWLMELTVHRNNCDSEYCGPKEESLIIQEHAGKDYSEEYKKLTGNFYLNF
ncbi:MAG: methyltransferase [Bacteroidales bacterium]|nr:methyltransferase [Bacteroidales bacterium]